MRVRLWNNLANVKFKAAYTGECSRLAASWGQVSSVVLAFASTSSVATWAIWAKFPWLWAGIVAVAQALQVAKPYFPFLKHDKKYLGMSFEFEKLSIRYERLWYDFENGQLDESKTESRFYKLREKEVQIERTYMEAPCPRFKWLIERAQAETESALARNFSLGDGHE